MVAPDPPTDLSADAVFSDTAELRWTAPDDDGGSPITGYFIERNLNNTSFLTLVADTGNTLTSYSDATLSARDNAKYRVSAINADGTSSPSDVASTTTATSEAQTITELLFTEWSLTGELSKTLVGDMTEVVHFFDREQIPGTKFAKAVTVEKINALGNELIVEHPTFFEQSDIFEVTCLLQVPDGNIDTFSVWIDLMQQMTTEVTRILKTEYAPSAGTGEFFRTTTAWTRDDTYFPDDAMLVRTLRFTLTRIVSQNDEVFLGYNGVLAFDTSESQGDSLPVSDYIYTEVNRVQIVQGWRNLPYITTDSPETTAIPIYFRGAFSGQFSCQMYLKKADFLPSTLNSLAQIFRPQANGELGTAAFMHSNTNTETPPITLTESFCVNITSVEKVSENEDLVHFNLRGNLTKPSEYSTNEIVSMGFEDGNRMLYENSIEMAYES